MARTWFAGPPTAKDSKGAVSKMGDFAQSNAAVESKIKVAVNDFDTGHQTTLTKAINSDSESDGSTTWVTPFSLPQKELNTHPTKEAIDASANLAMLIKQYSKPKDPETATTSEEPTTTPPVGMMEKFAPSSSAPRRAPTAQMVPLPPNAAVTTAPEATALSETSTTSLFGPCPSTMGISSTQVSVSATIPSSLSLISPSVLPSSQKASSKKATPKKSTSKPPQITLTPAPATAPSAFKDTALASHVQNTRFLSPMKQRTNAVKKCEYIRRSSPPRSALTPDSVPVAEEKRGRGRPRIRPEGQPLQQSRQHGHPVQPSTPCPQTGPSDQSNSSIFAPSAFPLPQQQAVTFDISDDLNSRFCSEEPRLWPGYGDHVTTLKYFRSTPETTHSEPIRACANHAAHGPHGHGVCITCHHGARRHLRATRPELLGSAWWPLCKTCGDNELLYTNPKRKACSCGKKWLCFACRMQEVERCGMKNSVEAEFRRRLVIGEEKDGHVKTVVIGFSCECGEEIGPDATLMRCIGCQGMIVGKLDPQEVVARENALTKNAFTWT